MLTALALSMIVVFMVAIMTTRMSALVALTLIPLIFALLAGFGASVGEMMLSGLREIAPTGVMLLFAILFFGIMIDAGLFTPLIDRIVRMVDGDPLRITMGTAGLALVVSLDGDGTTTYMICVSAMLPLYQRMQLDVRKMTCLIIMAAAITNVVPWGGPTARAAAALNVDSSALFVPLIPALLGCVCWLLFVAYVFGVKERKRVRFQSDERRTVEFALTPINLSDQNGRVGSGAVKPRLFWINLLLTSTLMILLFLQTVPLPVLFMIACSVALLLNYPSLQEQKARLSAHAGNALAVAGLIFAAGIFTGILSGTGMVDAMAGSLLGVIPDWAEPYLAPVTALASMPLTFFISNDAFYFGVLPVLAESAAVYGIAPEAIGGASLIGQQVHLLSPLVPSTYLLVGMANVELGAHQRFTLPWALGSCLIMFVCALLSNAFPLRS